MENKRSKKFNSFEGLVFSTNPELTLEREEIYEESAPSRQELKVQLDKKKRAGKAVTLITGFKGSGKELEELSKILKQKCGVGGSSKDGEILIQGDFVKKIMEILSSMHHQVKRVGG